MQNKLLLPGVSISIELCKSPTYLTAKIANAPSKEDALVGLEVSITACRLIMSYVIPAQSVIESHMVGLQSRPAHYNFNAVEMKTLTIQQGVQSYTKEECISGDLPKFLLLGFVKNANMQGRNAESCFKFENIGVQKCDISLNGRSYYGHPMEFDMTANPTSSYYRLLMELGSVYANRANLISLEDYKADRFFIAANFAANKDLISSVQPYKSGTIGLDLRFKQALTEVYNIVFFLIFDKNLQITEHRDVIIL